MSFPQIVLKSAVISINMLTSWMLVTRLLSFEWMKKEKSVISPFFVLFSIWSFSFSLNSNNITGSWCVYDRAAYCVQIQDIIWTCFFVGVLQILPWCLRSRGSKTAATASLKFTGPNFRLSSFRTARGFTSPAKWSSVITLAPRYRTLARRGT